MIISMLAQQNQFKFFRNLIVLFIVLLKAQVFASGYFPTQIHNHFKFSNAKTREQLLNNSIDSGFHYIYAPSVIRIGNIDHIFFCQNRESQVFRDSIFYYKQDAKTGKILNTPKAVVDPSLMSSLKFDQSHICDPTVIRLDVVYKGEKYNYIMMYTANSNLSENNTIGMAFAKRIDQKTWIKYDKPLLKPDYLNIDDVNQTVPSDIYSQKNPWGLGQPTATTISVEKSRFVLAYTDGSQFLRPPLARVVKVDLSMLDFGGPFISQPLDLSFNNFNVGTDKNVLFNFDMIYESLNEKFYFVSDIDVAGKLAPEPKFLSKKYQISRISGKGLWTTNKKVIESLNWEILAQVGEKQTSFRRNHNVGFLRNEYGGPYKISLSPRGIWLSVYSTSSCTFEDGDSHSCADELLNAGDGRFEWTYRLVIKDFFFKM